MCCAGPLIPGRCLRLVLWGPPGSGKTTLAYIMAQATNSYFSAVSAVSAGVADLRKVIEEAKERRRLIGAEDAALH